MVPGGTPNGELITFEGHASAPLSQETRAARFMARFTPTKVNENGEATYDGVLFEQLDPSKFLYQAAFLKCIVSKK